MTRATGAPRAEKEEVMPGDEALRAAAVIVVKSAGALNAAAQPNTAWLRMTSGMKM